MARTSRKQLEGIAERANAMLADRGSCARILVEGRNGYHALDLTTAQDIERGHHSASKTLHVGSTGELWTYLYALCEGLHLVSPPYV